ncbi:DUF6351 family protein [Georgenia halophila]|uniref:DUF6351 family protein n=1 Tax=Georgenia halophila TaxID=620889 RepID=A0ABP8KSY6_9MICO
MTLVSRRLGAAALAGAVATCVTVAVAGPGAVAAPGSSDAAADRDFGVEVLSGRPDMVTGGDVLVAVTVPRTVPVRHVEIRLDGADVTDVFAPASQDDDVLVGLVEGLDTGENTLRVDANGRGRGRPSTELELVNHPDTGPVFSGPQVPMYCSADGEPWNLGPVDENCHVDGTDVTYRYMTPGGELADLPDEDSLPADVATTTTTDGEEVPYVVRVERGTINRAVYETAILHEPGTPLPDAWTDTPGWNGKLVYTFGGGCGVGYRQGTATGGVEQDLLLSQGYAVASSTLNVYQNNCDDVTSAETAMMVKEHLVETYGPDTFTMGWGGSAGTMQQLLISNSYPGILDGVIGNIGYSDERTVTTNGHDCRGFVDYWADTDLEWTDAERRAVTGYGNPNACFGYTLFDGVDDPQRGCHPSIPVEDRWSATNPHGLRCTISDQVSNVYGVDENGYGRRAVPDNVGIQYGLEALQDGTITSEQFVDLNAGVGGMDVNGERTEARSQADPAALEAAYSTGRVNQFTGGLTHTPVLEVRRYRDDVGDFHDRYRSWVMRERVLAAHGNANTHVSWTSPDNPEVNAQMEADALATMDSWLTARLELASNDDAVREDTVAARPADLTDGCYRADGSFVSETISYDGGGVCNELFPYHADPRVVAGGPLASDILKCSLTGLDRDGYAVEFTDEQWARMQHTFPSGVCDWSAPGVGQVGLAGTWIDFG